MSETNAARKTAIVRLGEREIDLNKALPLTIGDLEDLEANSVDVNKLNAGNLIHLIWHLAKKIEPLVTRDEVRKLPVKLMNELAKSVQDASIPDPTPASS